MAYDTELAERIRELLAPVGGVDEKPMFGGLAFLINGHLAVAAGNTGGLLVRIRPEDADSLIQRSHVCPMVMRGHPLRGWLRVGSAALNTRRQLAAWVIRGADCARMLPPK